MESAPALPADSHSGTGGGCGLQQCADAATATAVPHFWEKARDKAFQGLEKGSRISRNWAPTKTGFGASFEQAVPCCTPMHPERSARRPSQGSLAATLTLVLVVLALLALMAR